MSWRWPRTRCFHETNSTVHMWAGDRPCQKYSVLFGGVGVLVGIFILLRDDGFFLRWDRCYMYLDARHDSDETSSCTRSPAWRSNCRKKAAALWIRVQQRCDRDAQETSGQTLRADVLHTQTCTRKKENVIWSSRHYHRCDLQIIVCSC